MTSHEDRIAMRKKWVAALRSGEYRQGAGTLVNRVDGGGTAYCCLGVLVRLCGHADHEMFGIATLTSGFRDVRDAVGLRTGWGDIDDTCRNLVSMNDGGASFAEIADLIEGEPDGLFVKSEPVKA